MPKPILRIKHNARQNPRDPAKWRTTCRVQFPDGSLEWICLTTNCEPTQPKGLLTMGLANRYPGYDFDMYHDTEIPVVWPSNTTDTRPTVELPVPQSYTGNELTLTPTPNPPVCSKCGYGRGFRPRDVYCPLCLPYIPPAPTPQNPQCGVCGYFECAKPFGNLCTFCIDARNAATRPTPQTPQSPPPVMYVVMHRADPRFNFYIKGFAPMRAGLAARHFNVWFDETAFCRYKDKPFPPIAYMQAFYPEYECIPLIA